MRSPYVIREVDGRGERDLLLALQLECLPEDDPVNPSKGHWWVTYRGAEPAAYAGLVDGYLCHAGVLKAHRGAGLQRRLIKKRIEKGRALGLPFVYSTTFDNPVSSNNLITCGFRMYTPERPWGATGTNYWMLPLGQD